MQGMTPIAKIEIAIAIPIAIWEEIGDRDPDRYFTIADLLADLSLLEIS